MARSGIEFMDRWIDKHVSYVEHGASSIEALDLADRCRAAAATEGISIEIEPQFGTLDEIIYEAMLQPGAT